MKKIILLIAFFLLYLFSFSQQYQTIKIFDCKDFSRSCDMKFYAKAEIGSTIHFTMENYIEGYKIFLYDNLGRKLMEQKIENEPSFNKEGLTNGLYIIKITDGSQVITKRILL